MFIPMQNLTPTGREIVKAIEELHRDSELITQQEIADRVGVSHRTVVRHIQFMKKHNLIEKCEGSPAEGGYKYVYQK